ncbi:hypothetical protein RZN25_09590, partial [Bacillaceae bacterium S4-13-56]
LVFKGACAFLIGETTPDFIVKITIFSLRIEEANYPSSFKIFMKAHTKMLVFFERGWYTMCEESQVTLQEAQPS